MADDGWNDGSSIASCLPFLSHRKFLMQLVVVCIVAVCATPQLSAIAQAELRLEVPTGFRISVYADRVPGARSMTLGPKGTVFVGSRQGGSVYALLDEDGDFSADKVLTIADGLDSPNGVAMRGGDLYVAEISRVVRFDDVESRLGSRLKAVPIFDGLPNERHHGWKFIAFGPDGYLYVPVGAPCNVCKRDDPRFASIGRIDPDNPRFQVVARGVRNSVGFDWHPNTGELWFTDNGRDMLGDDVPPDELNRVERPGDHFGFPHCHGESIRDPEFGAQEPCTKFKAPVQSLGAHVAALGMRFYRGAQFPKHYHGAIFIAEHGSWNRTSPVGYRLSVVRLSNSAGPTYESFATGWLSGSGVTGRPVDLLELPDGSLLLSDDHAGRVYRISYHGAASGAATR